MSNYIFDAADSVVTPGKILNAFGETGSGNFVVDAGAFLRSTDDNVAYLGGTAKWTVTVNGHLATDMLFGPALVVGGASGSKVTIGEEGSISNMGDSNGALEVDSDSVITNKGIIKSATGNGLGIYSDNTSSLTNSGVIAGFNAALYVQDAASFTLTNSGNIFGNLMLSNGATKLVNTGNITTSSFYGVLGATVVFGSGNDTLDNKGLISGYVDLGNGNNIAKSSGQLLGNNGSGVSLISGAGTDKVDILKGGVVSFGVNLGSGANTFNNAGHVGYDVNHKSFEGGTGVDTVKNTGTFDGGVDLFGGNDVFTNTGSIGGEIDLGTGDDKFIGGNAAEVVLDNAGKDDYKLGGGDDWFTAFGGEGFDELTDTVDGGTGVDTYDGSSRFAVYINMDSADHTSNGWTGLGSPVLTKSTAVEQEALKVDNIKNFENFFGTGNADIFFGNASANGVIGGGAGDELHGMGGNDKLDGGTGDDYLNGGAGADILIGGTGFDQLDYSAASDSGVTKATRDTITDFEVGVDAVHFQGRWLESLPLSR
ncbi:MAG: calcium-binding protein [Hyphomicrobiales bacterium]